MHGSRTEQRVCAPFIQRSSLHLMSSAAPHLTSTFHTLSLFSSSSSTPSEATHCAIPRAPQSGALAEHPNFTPYGTNLTDDVDEPLEFFVLFATACVLHRDSTWTVKNEDAELDVVTSLTLSSEITTTCANPRAQQSGALARHPTFTLQVLRKPERLRSQRGVHRAVSPCCLLCAVSCF